MSADPLEDFSSQPLFKRSASKKTRPRRERSPQAEQPGSSSISLGNGDDPSTSSELSGMAQAAKIKAKHKSKSRMTSQLSFGGDDAEASVDEFKVKKSALSRKLTLPQAPSTPSSSSATELSQAAYNSNSTPGLYSKSYLSELKASTPSTPAFNYDRGETAVAGGAIRDYDAVEDSFSMDAPSAIPSEGAIKAAREKRERLRHIGVTSADSASEDFISLSLTKSEPSRRDQGPHSESRLQREDDELDEGDEDMADFTGAKERIALGKKARKNEAKTRKATIADLIDEAEDDEDDEEMRDWEKAQIRRGGLAEEETDAVPAEDRTYKPHPVPTITTLPSLIAAMSRLSGTLSNLQGTHSTHESELEAVKAEQEQLDDKEREMRELVTNAEVKRAWMSDFHEWMETVATFLDEKFPLLEKYESEYLSLLSERLEMITTRRRDDDEDDLSLFFYIPQKQTENEDEFGRSVAQAPRAPSREARRASRAARVLVSVPRPSSLSVGPIAKLNLTPEDEQGYITDSDLLPADLEDFSLAITKLSQKVSSLLDDVKSVEFKDPAKGLVPRFAHWRDTFADSYTGAWGGLGMIGAWEFWARLEMAEWNPLEDGRSLDSFRWYAALYEYSRPAQRDAMEIDSTAERELGPDGDLVASMITTAVIPLLCKFFGSGGVDPYSSKHVKRAVDLAEQIEMCVERHEPKYQTFAKAFLVPFHRAIDQTYELIVPALDPSNPPPPFDPGAIPARRRFLYRRVKLLTGLLAWRRAVGAILGLDDLMRRLLIDVMLPVAHGGWDVGGQEIMSKAKSLLPKDVAKLEWTRPLQ